MTRVRRRRRLDEPGAEGSFEGTPSLRASGAAEIIPADDIDALITKYAGRRVPLDLVFPEPPKAPQAPDRLGGFNAFQHSDVLSEVYAREAQLKLMHRMLMRGASLQQIATNLGITDVAAARLRKELHTRLAQEATNQDGGAFAGKTIAFYDEIRSLALKEVDRAGVTPVNKARFMAVAIAAENNKHRFLQLTGFYQNLRLSPKLAETREDDGGMSMLRGMLKAISDPDAYADLIEGANLLGSNSLDTDPDHEVSVLG